LADTRKSYRAAETARRSILWADERNKLRNRGLLKMFKYVAPVSAANLPNLVIQDARGPRVPG
jgi:hypothetical protein